MIPLLLLGVGGLYLLSRKDGAAGGQSEAERAVSDAADDFMAGKVQAGGKGGLLDRSIAWSEQTCIASAKAKAPNAPGIELACHGFARYLTPQAFAKNAEVVGHEAYVGGKKVVSGAKNVGRSVVKAVKFW